jgi:hypothetical protein
VDRVAKQLIVAIFFGARYHAKQLKVAINEY